MGAEDGGRVQWVEYGGVGGGSTRSGVAATNKSWKNGAKDAHVSERSCATGAAIFKDANVTRVDVLDVDVEGHELQVLKGIDFTTVQIDVVSIEANDRAAKDYLVETLGYRLAHRHRVARMHFDEFYVRPGFEFLGEATAVCPETRLLRCSLKLAAGFGFRVGILNGCLRAAAALNATLLFEQGEFYKPRPGYGIDPKTSDAFLGLSDALPTPEAAVALRAAGCADQGLEIPLEKRLNFARWWSGDGGAAAREMVEAASPLNASLIRVRASREARRHGDAPFLSHDYSETANWLRATYANAARESRLCWRVRRTIQQARAGTTRARGRETGRRYAAAAPKRAPPKRFRRGGTTVALHVRNGDRLPGRRYERHGDLNLDDAYYVGAVAAVRRVLGEAVPLHVVAFGSSVALPNEKHSPELLDARGNTSEIPAALTAMPGVSAEVSLDGDAFEDLDHFARARVFVAARSQFSYVALALSRGVVVRPRSWRDRKGRPRFDAAHAASCHVLAADDGTLSDARLRAALADPACRNEFE